MSCFARHLFRGEVHQQTAREKGRLDRPRQHIELLHLRLHLRLHLHEPGILRRGQTAQTQQPCLSLVVGGVAPPGCMTSL